MGMTAVSGVLREACSAETWVRPFKTAGYQRGMAAVVGHQSSAADSSIVLFYSRVLFYKKCRNPGWVLLFLGLDRENIVDNLRLALAG